MLTAFRSPAEVTRDRVVAGFLALEKLGFNPREQAMSSWRSLQANGSISDIVDEIAGDPKPVDIERLDAFHDIEMFAVITFNGVLGAQEWVERPDEALKYSPKILMLGGRQDQIDAVLDRITVLAAQL